MTVMLLATAILSALRVIELPPGDIPLTETKVFEAADSGTVFRGAPDGSTRLTGGVRVTGWKDEGKGVWSALQPRDNAERPIYAEMLFVNGRRARRARWPEQGFFRFCEMTQYVARASAMGTFISARPERNLVELLAKVPAGDLPFAQIVGHLKWDVERSPLVSFTNRFVTFGAHPSRSWCAWQRGNNHELENVRFGFTKPGDWFFDGVAGRILYRPLPGEKIGEIRACVPREGLETLVAVKGDRTFGRVVRDIAFENVTFAHSAPVGTRGPTCLRAFQAACRVASAAVTVDGADNVTFRNCRFEHLGNYAVWFRSGCRGGGVYSCEISDLGAGGVRIGTFQTIPAAAQRERCNPPPTPSRETAPWMTSGIVVDDCLIAHGGRFHTSGVGVLIGHAADCRVTHNEICDLFYTGVSVGWVWGYGGSPTQRNEISFNHIHDIGQGVLADMGGIYTLGTSFGTAISNNVIHAVRTASYGGWGLYNDEGSEGIVLENNLVYDTDDASYHSHYGCGNVLRNNILLDSRCGQIAATRPEKHRAFTVTGNVIAWKQGGAFKPSYAGTAKERTKIGWASNVWWCASGEQDFNGTNFTAWAARVGDRGSVFADPKFRDGDGRSCALAPDSPALKLGFVPFDPSLAGRRKQ